MNTNRYLFLDIDDVMVTTQLRFYKRRRIYDSCPFDQKCVKVLNQIIVEKNPIVIVSSDWKDHYDINQLNEIFADNGVKVTISDVTPCLWGTQFKSVYELEICRAHEIMKYVQDNNITNFVAVDDLNLTEWLPNNFVWCTQSFEGIKQCGKKEKILNILI